MNEISRATTEIITEFIDALEDYDGEFIQIETSKAKIIRAALLDYVTTEE